MTSAGEIWISSVQHTLTLIVFLHKLSLPLQHRFVSMVRSMSILQNFKPTWCHTHGFTSCFQACAN